MEATEETFEFNVLSLSQKEQLQFQTLLSSGVKIKSLCLENQKQINTQLQSDLDKALSWIDVARHCVEKESCIYERLSSFLTEQENKTK